MLKPGTRETLNLIDDVLQLYLDKPSTLKDRIAVLVTIQNLVSTCLEVHPPTLK